MKDATLRTSKLNTAALFVAFVVLTLATTVPLRRVGLAADPPAVAGQSARSDCARIFAEIARLNLQNALRINERNPNTLPLAQVAVLQEQVALAEEWQSAAEAAAAGKAHNSAVAESEVLLKAAEEDYAGVLRINRIAPVSRFTLERSRLKLDLAKARLAMARQVDATSPVAMLQFQLERLRENISNLATQQVRTVDLD